MKKEILLPALAAAGGAAGFALRRWELATAFEPDTGLPIAGMPATYALAAVSAGMILALALLGRGEYAGLSGREDDSVFAAVGNSLYAMAALMAAFLLIGGGALMAASFFTGRSVVFTRPILAVLAAAAGVCLLPIVKSRFRGPARPRYDVLQLIPAYACCMWLVAAYQARAGDPVQLDYIYELAAVIASLLGLYYAAGFSFGRGKPFQFCLFSLLGVYFSLTTLADGHDLPSTLLYGFAAIYQLCCAWALLHNAAQPGGGERNVQETEETPDEP